MVVRSQSRVPRSGERFPVTVTSEVDVSPVQVQEGDLVSERHCLSETSVPGRRRGFI